jgi:hypothetical protein
LSESNSLLQNSPWLCGTKDHRSRGSSMMSMGHKYTLVIASYTKWVLQGEMSPEWRLKFLDHLEKMTDSTITPAVIALVEPMNADGREIYHEAQKLGYDIQWSLSGGARLPNFFDVLHKQFDIFAALNPSLRAAYDEAVRPWQSAYEAAS